MEKDIISGFVNMVALPQATVPIALFSVYVYKTVKERFMLRKTRRTETLDRLLAFFSDVHNGNNFVKEQLFFNHFGVLLSSREIDLLLSTKTPSFHLSRFIHAISLVEISGAPLALKIKKNRKLPRLRKWYLLWYALSGMAGVLLLLNTNAVFSVLGPKSYAPWAIMIFSLLTFAWVNMDAALKASSAISLQQELQEDV
ncbi:hypothetical protein [Salinisphaera aquimarina]|uniref:Uncharacterized protein n=1 Tax=Salinisphaera aquimarina TaxID=2094031 RepID=A0ABV7EMP8_9GAMM